MKGDHHSSHKELPKKYDKSERCLDKKKLYEHKDDHKTYQRYQDRNYDDDDYRSKGYHNNK